MLSNGISYVQLKMQLPLEFNNQRGERRGGRGGVLYEWVKYGLSFFEPEEEFFAGASREFSPEGKSFWAEVQTLFW